MSKVHYFALGFSQPGCLTTGSTAYAVSTRREVSAALKDSFHDDAKGARKALADLGLRNLWSHAKRHGFSSIFRELDTGTSEVLCFMGMTEDEYNQSVENEDY